MTTTFSARGQARRSGAGLGRCAGIAALIALTLLAAGCGGFSGTSSEPRLSEAMARASDTSTGSREVSSGSTAIVTDRTDADTSMVSLLSSVFGLIGAARSAPEHEASSLSATTSSTPGRGELWVSLAGGPGLTGGDLMTGGGRAELRAGLYLGEHLRLSGIGGVGWSGVRQSAAIATSVKGEMISLHTGLQLDLFTTPRHTLLGQYFMVGAGLERMAWSYRNIITVNGTPVGEDALYGVDLAGGIGLDILQSRSLQLGGELRPGVMIWLPDTEGGFANDLFAPTPYLRLALTLGFRI